MLALGAFGLSALALAGLQRVRAASFQLAFNHSGENFLNNWVFYNGIDTNNTGNVLFQSQTQAQQEQLTFLNSAGNFIIKVDNTTSGANDPTFGRPSIKLLSSYTITSGNLVLFDAVHLPFGCSVWPAFWTQGPVWPDDGEIDIMEGVNMQTQNDFSLHTLDGCTHPSNASSVGTETGQLISTDCFNQTNGNQGCIVEVPGNSYGANFANAGGGVYAMNWNDTGIYLWFFARGSIPADLPTSAPNPDGWGTPTALYPTSSCNTAEFIKPQTLILDITVCGDFAGQAAVFAETCSGTCTDLVPTASNYNNAYFEISYIRVFENGLGLPSSTASGGATVTTNASGATITESSGAVARLVSSFTASSLFAFSVLELAGIYLLTL
ncbi:concanavalin A-like lectin/glucanase domain-containing protein [Phellopilus nigrolimitatus]|nr:concanavalin A-like lectin/glucanase domain-containing protein [Phellopilus nigrolimitatus]